MRIILPLGLALGLAASAAALADDHSTTALPPKDVSWSFENPFGTYDQAALQRGFQVYKEVCSACHDLSHVAFHALGDEGGPNFTQAQVKAIAAAYKVPAGPNDKGETVDASGNPLTRAGIPADYFPPPFANEEVARMANNGALPPDLSLIVKAREGGPPYVYSIATGFGQKPPAWFHVMVNKYYNPYFEGWNISMAPPLTDGQVTFSDGSPNKVADEAHDVVTFLSWASDPTMDQRKRLGFGVMAFMLLLSGLLYLSYRKVWHGQH